MLKKYVTEKTNMVNNKSKVIPTLIKLIYQKGKKMEGAKN